MTSKWDPENITQLKWDYMRGHVMIMTMEKNSELTPSERDELDALRAHVQDSTAHIPAAVLKLWEGEAELMLESSVHWAIYCHGK